MDESIDIRALLDKATAGDAAATLTLIMMQRQGRAMRLYPFGRKGPLDEGCVPFIVCRDRDSGLVRIEKTNQPSIAIPFLSMRVNMMHLFHLCGRMFLDHMEDESKYGVDLMDMKNHWAFRTRMDDGYIETQFMPDAVTITFGFQTCRTILKGWSILINDSIEPIESFGFIGSEGEEEYRLISTLTKE